eukprot:TRINITY_DN7837_c0_g1_i1.p1 TRINITY_DN7837_c0_g1~~TRINITY_DN7837_c0_g1_i1.p1  ORF type:complete len:672 (-),score=152.12 TRINITY_DN7837_c0_g1_i1:1422-3437(-)
MSAHPFSAYAMSTGPLLSRQSSVPSTDIPLSDAPSHAPSSASSSSSTIPPAAGAVGASSGPQLQLDAGRELLSMLRSSSGGNSVVGGPPQFPSSFMAPASAGQPSELFRPPMRPVDASQVGSLPFGPFSSPQIPLRTSTFNHPAFQPVQPSGPSRSVSALMNDLSQYKASNEGLRASAGLLQSNVFGRDLQPDDKGKCSFSVPEPEHDGDASSVKLKEVARYARPDRSDSGMNSKLMAANDKYVLYSIVGGAIRAIKQADTTARVLLSTGQHGEIVCMEANPQNDSLFGSVDEQGSVLIFKIKDSATSAESSENKEALGYEVIWNSGDDDDQFFKLVWHPKNPKLLAISTETTVELWQIEPLVMVDDDSCNVSLVIRQHPQQITALSFSPSGNLLASACKDGYVRIWNIHDGSIKTEFVADDDSVSCVNQVGWISERYVFAASDENRLLSVIDVDNGAILSSLQLQSPNHLFSFPQVSRCGRVAFVAFSSKSPSFRSTDHGILAIFIALSTESVPRFAHIAPFFTSGRIMSYELKEEWVEGVLKAISIFCVQPKAVQSFSLSIDQLTHGSGLEIRHLVEAKFDDGRLSAHHEVVNAPPQGVEVSDAANDHDADDENSDNVGADSPGGGAPKDDLSNSAQYFKPAEPAVVWKFDIWLKPSLMMEDFQLTMRL